MLIPRQTRTLSFAVLHIRLVFVCKRAQYDTASNHPQMPSNNRCSTISTVVVAVVALIVSSPPGRCEARNFSTAHRFGDPTAAVWLRQMVHPEAPPPAPLRSACGLAEAATYVRYTLLESERRYRLCRARNRYRFDAVRQTCQQQLQLHRSGRGLVDMRHQVHRHWDRMHDAYIATAGEQLRLADGCVQRLLAVLAPVLGGALQQQVQAIRYRMDAHRAEGGRFMQRLEALIERELENFERLQSSRQRMLQEVGVVVDDAERWWSWEEVVAHTLDAVEAVLEAAEAEVERLQTDVMGAFRQAMGWAGCLH